MAAYYQPPYAELHFRLAAWALDLFIFAVVSLIPLGIISVSGSRAEFIAALMSLQAVYYLPPMVAFHTTPGKRILDLRIVMQDGSPLQPDAAILRYLAFFLTMMIPFGFLASGVLLFVNPERLAFHDRLAKTAVVSGYSRT